LKESFPDDFSRSLSLGSGACDPLEAATFAELPEEIT
jgi:hypothetical protein